MNQGENNNKNFNINQESGEIEISSEELYAPVFEEAGTYCMVGSMGYGILEVDLQSTKQKGIESRSISFSIPLNKFSLKADEDRAEMLFKSEKDFEKFKVFISKLNWND